MRGKQMMSLLLCIVLVAGMMPVGVNAADPAAVWNGIADTTWYDASKNEFDIADANQLAGLAALVNGGNSFEGKTINLIANVKLGPITGSYQWKPIGTTGKAFEGCFDGKGYEVQGLNKIFDTSYTYYGLFGLIGAKGTVKNLKLVNCAINYTSGINSAVVGAVAGESKGSIDSCEVSGNINGFTNIGGIVGSVTGGNVSNCSSIAVITGSFYIGGICGRVELGNVTGCFSEGSVTGSNSYVGGVVGIIKNGCLSDCHSNGEIKSTGSGTVGGVAGYTDIEVLNCYSAGNISGTQYVGGIAGIANKGILNCYSIGNISGTDYIGGITGSMSNGALQNCYAAGNVSGSTQYGRVSGRVYNCNVKYCYYQTIEGNAVEAVGAKSGDTCTVENNFPKTAAELGEAKTAWLLNTSNGTAGNTGVWAKGTTPVFTASDNLPVHRVLLKNIAIPAAGEHYTDAAGRIALIESPSDGTGKYFFGWYTDDMTFSSSFDINAVFTEDKTLYANFGKRIITLSDYTAPWSGSPIEYAGTVSDNGLGIAGAPTLNYIYYIDSSGKIKSTNANSGAASEGAAPVEPGTYYVQAESLLCPVMYAAKSNPAKLVVSGGNVKPQISSISSISAANKSAELSFNCNKGGNYYYSVRIPGTSIPTAAELKSLGAQGAALEGANTITLTNLAQATKYVIYIVFYDGSDAASNVVQAEFTTTSAWDGTANISWYVSNPAASTFYISDADDLAGLAALVNSNSVYYDASGYVTTSTEQGASQIQGMHFNDKTVYLAASIDLGGKEWKPIGSANISEFQGTFDGCNYEIRGLSIKSGTAFSGLFGSVGSYGKVKNLRLAACDINIAGGSYIGAVAGLVMGTIENCSVSGNISGSERIGGIAGSLPGGTIRACSSTAVVTASADFAGGIVGSGGGCMLEKCSSKGNVTGSSGYAGGIIGLLDSGGVVQNCYSTGNVSGGYAGGVAGKVGQSCTVKNCYALGTVNGASKGRLVGETQLCTVMHCFYKKIEGDATPAVVNQSMGTITEDILPKTTEELKSAKLAWTLNTSGGTQQNSGIWAQGESPIFSDNSTLRAVYKVTLNNIVLPEEKELYTDTEGRTGLPDAISDGTGRYFLGWYNDNDTFSVPFNQNTVIEKDTELYADFGKRIISLSDYTTAYTGSEVKYAGAVKDNAGSIPGVPELQYIYYMDNSGNEKTTNVNSGAASEGGAPVYANTYYVQAVASADTVSKIDTASSNYAKLIVSGNPVIKSISVVNGAAVDFGTGKTEALAALAAHTNILDSANGSYQVALNWEITGYNGYAAGVYTAVGTFTLPEGVIQSNPALALQVTADITVGQPVNASINPNKVIFDLSNPADAITTINWGDAQSVTGVVYGPDSMPQYVDYTLNGSMLAISKESLSGLGLKAGDTKQFTIHYKYGACTTFTVEVIAAYKPSSNALLSELKVNGQLIAGFSESCTEYTVKVPEGTMPGSPMTVITAVASDSKAAVKINPSEFIPGSATIEVTAEDKTTKLYTIKFEYEVIQMNWPPRIRKGIPESVTAGIKVNTPYTLDLSTIFVDLDDDPMTYRVSVNSGDYQSAQSTYSYTPVAEGVTTLAFTANDGIADSDWVYTVTLNASSEQPANPYITAIEPVKKAQVFVGSNEGYAIGELQPFAKITDSYGNIYNVELSWTIKNYDGNTIGDYEATGTFVLPSGVDQSKPETPLAVKTVVSIVPLISAEVSPKTAVFKLDAPGDVSTTINWGSAGWVMDIQRGTSNGPAWNDGYTVTNDILTIKEAYLSGLQMNEGASEEFTIRFNIGNPASFKVEALKGYTPGSNAFLSDLSVNNVTVTDFVYGKYDYSMELPWGTLPDSLACNVTAAAQDPKAQVSITQVANFPGIAIVKVTAEDCNTTQEYRISFTLQAASNRAPKRKTGVPTAVSQSVNVNSAYTLDLSSIFEDEDGDPLLYKVSVNSTEAVNADKVYSYTPNTEGITTLVFTANDSKLDSTDTYAVTLTANNPQPMDYSLTITAGTGGKIVSGSNGNYKAGSVIEIAAAPDSGYSFNSWASSGGGSFGNVKNAGTTFTMPANTVTIAAYFSQDSSGNGDNSGNGNNSAGGGGDSAASGVITTTPKPNNPDEMTIPVGSVTGTAAKPMEVKTQYATLFILPNMLTPEMAGNTKQVTFVAGKADTSKLPAELTAQIGNRLVIELNLKLDGSILPWNNTAAPVTVTIPYKPTAEELADPEHITVWYIDGSGKAVAVPSGRYDAATGKVTFTTTHFSKYAVVYVKKSFEDLEGLEWAKKQIEALASKGIMEGRTEKGFAPKAGITRAEYIAALVRTVGVTAKEDTCFNDVAIGSKYYKEIAIAKKLGISNGTGNNSFEPEETISRQDMLVLTERALRSLKKLSSTGTAADLDRFTDRTEVGGYAIESIAALVKERLIEGSSGKLNIKSDTTRAETAVFLYRLYNR